MQTFVAGILLGSFVERETQLHATTSYPPVSHLVVQVVGAVAWASDSHVVAACQTWSVAAEGSLSRIAL